MRIEIDGFWYEWVISTQQEFKVLESSEHLIRIQVPADADESLVRSFIQLNGNVLRKRNVQKEQAEIQMLTLFDTSYFIYLETSLSQAYIKGSRIYVPHHSKQLSTRKIAALKKHLLLTELSHQIGHWEEQLGMLCGNIIVKKLKDKWYTTNTSTADISFSILLANQSHARLSYITLRSLLDTTTMDNSSKQALLTQHIPNHFAIADELSYEQSKSNT